MNYLAHAMLAGSDDGFLAGSILGDFMRGQRLEAFPANVQAGIRMHRRTDAFTDDHPAVARARRRFAKPYRRYSGIVLDVVFDHLLARDWARYSPRESVDERATRTYKALRAHEEHLPERLARVLPMMEAENWLAAYGDLDQVERALRGISKRLRHANPLTTAMEAVTPLLPVIAEDFEEFFPDCLAWASETRVELLAAS